MEYYIILFEENETGNEAYYNMLGSPNGTPLSQHVAWDSKRSGDISYPVQIHMVNYPVTIREDDLLMVGIKQIIKVPDYNYIIFPRDDISFIKFFLSRYIK